jgi:hypothetical protein
MHIVKISTVLLLIIVVAIGLLAWIGAPLPREALRDLHIVLKPSDHPNQAVIDGGIISSGAAVSGVEHWRSGHSIIIVVRQGLIFPNRRSGTFHLEISIPNDVDTIAYSHVNDVIWHR